MKVYIGLMSALGCVFLSSCTPNLGGDDYQAQNVGEISKTTKGVIIARRAVHIHAKNPSDLGTGAVVGGVAGLALGSTLGNGEGSLVTSVLGALGGGAAGHYMEEKMTDQSGYEYQIQLDQGAIITLSQGPEPDLNIGQHVLVIESGHDRSRVVADATHENVKQGTT